MRIFLLLCECAKNETTLNCNFIRYLSYELTLTDWLTARPSACLNAWMNWVSVAFRTREQKIDYKIEIDKCKLLTQHKKTTTTNDNSEKAARHAHKHPQQKQMANDLK